MATEWHGERSCNFCGAEQPAKLIDGATVYGPWAVMCPPCHASAGRGLGVGRGQEYTRQPDGRYLKTAG